MKITFVNPRQGSHVFAAFEEMREMEELCDIKLETNVDEMSVHKVVLAACSPYFREVFKNIDADEESYVIPEEHDSKVVSAIIGYFYTGRLEMDASYLPKLLKTAVSFEAQDIVERCEDHVVRQLTIENCLEYYSQAEEYNIIDLQKTIIRFINWHFAEIVEQETFVNLSAKNLCSFVSSNVLNVEKEEVVYEALWKWFNHDKDSRKHHCQDVFSNIRFFQLDPNFITERVIPELAKGVEVCKNEIKQAIIYQSSEKKKRLELTEKMNPRYPSKVIFMFDSKSSLTEKYDPITEDCVKEKRMMDNRPISSVAAVVVNDDLYIISSSRVEKFDKLSLTWDKVAVGKNIRDATICADKDCFFVIGGRDQGSAVKCFNVLSRTWSPEIANMPVGRRLAAAVATNGRVFVMGGYGPDEPLASTHRYSLRAGKWKELAAMNAARFGFTALLIRNNIFVLGGKNPSTLNTVESFDLDSQVEEWKRFEYNMTRPRSEFGAVVFNGQIWCLGGRGENSIERFDFGTKSWDMVGKLGEIRYGMSCVLYPMF